MNVELVFHEDIHAVTKKWVEFRKASHHIEDVYHIHVIGVDDNLGQMHC